MKYLYVRWLHTSPEYPTGLFSELDDERWEVRKVDVFADGSMAFADGERRSGDCDLGEMATPELHEIANDPVFLPREISAEEFEAVWRQAVGPAPKPPTA